MKRPFKPTHILCTLCGGPFFPVAPDVSGGGERVAGPLWVEVRVALWETPRVQDDDTARSAPKVPPFMALARNAKEKEVSLLAAGRATCSRRTLPGE